MLDDTNKLRHFSAHDCASNSAIVMKAIEERCGKDKMSRRIAKCRSYTRPKRLPYLNTVTALQHDRGYAFDWITYAVANSAEVNRWTDQRLMYLSTELERQNYEEDLIEYTGEIFGSLFLPQQREILLEMQTKILAYLGEPDRILESFKQSQRI